MPRHGGDDAWMAVTHGRHVVVGVEIARAVGANEPDAFPPDEIEGACVEQHRWAERALAAGNETSHVRIETGCRAHVECVEFENFTCRCHDIIEPHTLVLKRSGLRSPLA